MTKVNGIAGIYTYGDVVEKDGVIDISGGDLEISYELKEDALPVVFGTVNGSMYVRDANLVSLHGFPSKVDDSLTIRQSDKLTSLKYCPSYIGGDFYLRLNEKLMTLKYIPQYIGGSFKCTMYITDVYEYRWIFFSNIGGNIEIKKPLHTDSKTAEKLTMFFNENKNPPKKDLPRLLSELRKMTL